MLQDLLTKQFHLQVRIENRPVPVFALTAIKNPPKLRQPDNSDGRNGCRLAVDTARSMQGAIRHNATMADLAHVLPRIASGYIDLPVVGLTGLSGSYDFQFEWVVKEKQTDAPGPTVFVAVEGLGLKPEQRKHPAPIVVIERVDRTPAVN